MSRITIVEPCSEDWSAMTPAERGRFCARCRETVVDLSRVRRAEAERMVRAGEVRCAQLALDEHGRPVWPPEPASRAIRLARRLAVVGALMTGCASGEGGAAPGPLASVAEPDAEAPGEPPCDAEPPLGIGSGSLLTGRQGEIPLAPPRALPPVERPPASPPGPTRNGPTGNGPPPAPQTPVPQTPVPQTLAPPEDELAPRVQHLRGRVAIRR